MAILDLKLTILALTLKAFEFLSTISSISLVFLSEELKSLVKKESCSFFS
jgi:hypothetical protein